MIPSQPFSPDAGVAKTPGASQTADPRRRRLSRGLTQPSGLAALAQGGEEFESPSTLPQQVGQAADLSLQEPEIPEISRAPEIDQPSMLSTERVQRAPMAADARPLLSDDERFGSLVSEVMRGEESGSPAPGARGMSSRARQEALGRFLRPSASKDDDGSAELRGNLTEAQAGLGAARSLTSGLRSLAQPTARERLAGARGSNAFSGSAPTMWTVDAQGIPIPTFDPSQMVPELNRQMHPGLPSPGEAGAGGFDAARGAVDAMGGATSALSIMRALLDLKEGRNPQAALGLLSGTGGLLRTAGSPTAAQLSGISRGAASGLGTAGSAIGGLAGLAGAGLAGARGDVPGAVLGGVQGAGSLASLAGSSLGASAPALTGAAATSAALPAGAATAGTAATLSALGAALGITGGVAALGPLLHMIFDQIGGESQRERTIRRNNSARMGVQDYLTKALQNAASPRDLLGISAAGPLLGQGQVQFAHDKYGTGGDYQQAMSPAYEAAVTRALSGDPAALRDFISGVRIRTGHTGTTTPDFAMTDLYRRNLAHSLGLTDTTGLFEATPAGMSAGEIAERIAAGDTDTYGSWENNIPALQRLLKDGLTAHQQNLGESYGPTARIDVPISPYYRAPGELQLTPAQRTAASQALEKLLRDKAEQEQILRDYSAAMNQGGG